jgi:hypothetical protein
MQNKANLRNDKMNITIDITTNYEYFYRSPGPKNKPNSNPIKPKTNPIKANSNPIQTQFWPGKIILPWTYKIAHLQS